MSDIFKPDPNLDLVFERTTTVPIDKIWKAWTHSDILKKWFCPKPWNVTDCRIDLRPGGEFYTMFEGPNGEKVPNNGTYLEIEPNKRLVWTNALTKGFRPVKDSDPNTFEMVCILTLSKTDRGTWYKAVVAHADVESRKKHEAMGFQEGWGMAFDQLVELQK